MTSDESESDGSEASDEPDTSEATTVAIACQGGGSHTAFTAGVLAELFESIPEDHELVGLSGTSGGAACAAIAWYGHLHPDEAPRDLLTDFWAEIAATSPAHRVANDALRWAIQMQRAGVPVPDVSPSNSPFAKWGQREFRRMIEAQIDFEELPALLDESHPGLFVSAIDVCSGTFEVFRESELSAEAILASAAEPHIFEAVDLDGQHYWDGLFSKNPPINDFMDADDVPDPDEIWLVKINPQERPDPPQSMEGINNRRNELSGNLSLNAELRFVERVNEWIDQGYLPDRYTHTEIERITLPRCGDLDWRTKLDRDAEFIQRLFRQGEQEARSFLDAR